MPTFPSHLSSCRDFFPTELITGGAEQLSDRVENSPEYLQETDKKSSSLTFTCFKAEPALAEWGITSFSTIVYIFSGPTAHQFKRCLKCSCPAASSYF